MSDCCGEVIYEGLCKRGRPVKVLDCAVCGFKHLHPKPSEEELEGYYKKEYFQAEKPDYAKNSGTESEYQFLVDQEKIEAALEGCHGNMDSGEKTVLDFGCGPSAPFLKHFKKVAGGEPWLIGVEPSQADPERRVNLGDQAMVLLNSLSVVRYKFDIINLGFVLEHVANPVATLLEVKKHLVPGGRVIVEVPNDFNPLQKFLWKSGTPWWVSSPDHVNYFDFKTLAGTLNKAGFRVHNNGTTYPVELFIAHAQDFRNSSINQVLVQTLRADLQRLWKHVGRVRDDIGRTAWIVAVERERS
jgi:SAM-dependent methyltransferase